MTAARSRRKGELVMLHLSELDVRTDAHDRRIDHANQYGWMRSSSRRAPRTKAIVNVLCAIRVRVAPGPSRRESTGIRVGLDAPAMGNGVGTLA